MPFKSQAQSRFMFSQHPKIAKEWADKTKSIKALPQHVGNKKRSTGSYNMSDIHKALSLRAR